MNEKKETNINFGNVNYESLQHYDLMSTCLDVLMDNFSPLEGDFYRLVHNPIIDNDNLPQGFQIYEPLTRNSVQMPKQIAFDAPDDEKLEFLESLALSYNVSDELLKQFALTHYKQRRTPQGKASFKKKFGEYIVKVHITKNNGLVENFVGEGGHINILPFNNFDIAVNMDLNYGFRKINLGD